MNYRQTVLSQLTARKQITKIMSHDQRPSWGGGARLVLWLPQAAQLKQRQNGHQINILKIDFVYSTSFKLFSVVSFSVQFIIHMTIDSSTSNNINLNTYNSTYHFKGHLD
jgi:hypothetical protein